MARVLGISVSNDRGEKYQVPPAVPPRLGAPLAKPIYIGPPDEEVRPEDTVEETHEAPQQEPPQEMPEVNMPSFELPPGFNPMSVMQAMGTIQQPKPAKAFNLITLLRWAGITFFVGMAANDIFTAWLVHLFK